MVNGSYLVTGSTGLVGSSILSLLKDVPGVSVIAIYHVSPPKIFGSNITYVQCDLTDRMKCRKIIKDVDYVYMMAGILSATPVLAKDPVMHINSNIIINVNSLEASYLNGVKKIVWLSGTTVYPDNRETGLDEAAMWDCDPPRPYFMVGWMNRYIEVLCRAYATQFPRKIDTTVLRVTTIYGENEGFDFGKCHVLPALVRRVVERDSPLEIWGDGSSKRDLIHADDVAQACYLALSQMKGFNSFNLGSNEQHSVSELLDLVIKIDGFSDAEIVYDSSRETAVQVQKVDCARFRNMTGFVPVVGIEQGVRRLIEAYKKIFARPA